MQKIGATGIRTQISRGTAKHLTIKTIASLCYYIILLINIHINSIVKNLETNLNSQIKIKN